jgi:tripartite-type tricarboxylate transporter receptor subunit TctC
MHGLPSIDDTMPNLIRIIFIAAAVSFPIAANAVEAAGAKYPVKPIRIISPLAAGGSADALTRLVGEALADALGQPVVVDNRPGASGIIGVDLVAKASPDGYTILIASGGNVAISPFIYAERVPFNVERDLAPVALIATQPFVAHVSPAFPARTIQDVIALAKAKPGAINYASAGTGSTAHVMTLLFENLSGARMTHVPFKSAPAGRTAVMAREVDFMFDGLLATLPLFKAGRLRPLGVTGAKRSPVAPDIPTIAEGGVKGYSADAWYAMFVPRGTPKAVVGALSAAMTRILKSPAQREKLSTQGVEPAGGTPEALSAFVKSEIAKWSKVVKQAGVKPE